MYAIPAIVEYAKSLPYEPCQNPGKRTRCLSELDQDFFFWINKKILSVLYPMNYRDMAYQATTAFGSVPPNLEHDGWVHEDTCEFSALIYLTKQENCGTTVYTPKQQHLKTLESQDKKAQYYWDNNNTDGVAEQKEKNNSRYDESIIVKSKYNRLVLFDAKMSHAAQPYMSETSTEHRLALHSFFNSITSTTEAIKYHGAELRRI